MQLTDALPYLSHLSVLVAGLGTMPAYGKLRKAFVSICRAVVAHEDGDDSAALADVKDVVEDLAPNMVGPVEVEFKKSYTQAAEEAKFAFKAAPDGTVKAWT